MSSEKFSYGGQAVMEGVMMRGAQKAAVAARDPNGEIHIKEIPLNATLYRGWVSRTPFVRGLVGLWDALGLGTRALLWSADVALIEGTYYRVQHNGASAWVAHSPAFMQVDGNLDDVPTLKTADTDDAPAESGVKLVLNDKVKILPKPEEGAKSKEYAHAGDVLTVTGFKPAEKGEDVFTGAAATLMVVFSLALGIGLFFVLPTAASSGAGKLLSLNATGTNIVEEAIKLSLFLGYILLIGTLPDVKRLFRYHGAEHKAINAYEAGEPLEPSIIQQYPLEHPRCGTAFLLNVIIISIIINSLIGRFDNNLLLLIPTRILTIPLVAGIAYEWLRWTAKNLDKPLVGLLIKPNLALQRLTVKEPTDEMVEVAVMALQRVLVAEGLPTESPAPVGAVAAEA